MSEKSYAMEIEIRQVTGTDEGTVYKLVGTYILNPWDVLTLQADDAGRPILIAEAR